MADYTAYLTQKVLDDHEIVTHRSLSRALNVHIDHAKRMLYAFYTSHSSSVSATYLIRGVRNRDQQAQTPVSTHLLVVSPQLEHAKAQFSSMETIFVYSVQAGQLPTLGVLGDVAVRSAGDALVMGREWGVIRNGYVRRREGVYGGALAEGKEEKKKTGVKEEKGRAEEKKKGGIFDAFSKRPKAKREATATASETGTAGMKPKAASAQSRQKKEDVEEDDGDIEIGLDDDDDEGVEPEEVFIKKDKNRQDEPGRVKTTATARMRERQAREEELRRMMEGESEKEEEEEEEREGEEDEEMVDAEEPPAEQAVPRDRSPSPPPPPPQKGKRLVTRKRTVKDAEGFLVTTEEKEWESVGEEEEEKQERPKQRKRSQSEEKGGKKEKKEKKQEKQGSIMSFFAKRT